MQIYSLSKTYFSYIFRSSYLQVANVTVVMKRDQISFHHNYYLQQEPSPYPYTKIDIN